MRSRVYGANERQRLHRHAEARLIIVLSGAFREEGLGAGGHFERGDILVRPPFASHGDFAFGDGARYLQLAAPPGFFSSCAMRRGWGAKRGRLDLARREVVRALQSRHAAAYIAENASMAAYEGFVDECALLESARLLAGDPAIGVAELAQGFGIRPDRLSKRFKMRFGVSPRAYAKAARLERAMAQLALGAGSMAEIAAACGYFDQSHLSRDMKRATMMTPLEFHRLSRR